MGPLLWPVGHTSGGWRGFTVYCTFFHILGACQFFTRINNASAGCRRKHCNAMPCHGPAARGQLLPALASQQGSMAWHGMAWTTAVAITTHPPSSWSPRPGRLRSLLAATIITTTTTMKHHTPNQAGRGQAAAIVDNVAFH